MTGNVLLGLSAIALVLILFAYTEPTESDIEACMSVSGMSATECMFEVTK